MAHKKAAGSTRNGRDSKPKYLGVKVYGGQKVPPGGIILRQRGTRFYPGHNTGMGRDHTIFAKIPGIVRFSRGGKFLRRQVFVEPLPATGSGGS